MHLHILCHETCSSCSSDGQNSAGGHYTGIKWVSYQRATRLCRTHVGLLIKALAQIRCKEGLNNYGTLHLPPTPRRVPMNYSRKTVFGNGGLGEEDRRAGGEGGVHASRGL